jgi:hypothetical protein
MSDGSHTTRQTAAGPAIVSDFDGFLGSLRTRVVDEVVVALPVKSFYSQASGSNCKSCR